MDTGIIQHERIYQDRSAIPHAATDAKSFSEKEIPDSLFLIDKCTRR
jgi:hypothetical protein